MHNLHKKIHNESMDPSPRGNQQMPGQIMIPPAPSPKKIKTVIALVLGLALVAGIAFFLRPGGVFIPKPAPTTPVTLKIKFDAEKVAALLKDPATIVIVKDGQLLVNNLRGDEAALMTQEKDFFTKISRPLISQSRNFLTWQVEKGLVKLDISKQELFFIERDLSRQAYDLSPLEDKILFLTATHLMESNLTQNKSRPVLPLPKLANDKMRLNQVKYSPDGQKAYLRSIYSGEPTGRKEFVVDLKTNQVTEITNAFTEPIGLTPLWLKDSQSLLATRENSLTLYNLSDNQLTELATNTEDEEVIGTFGSYSLNPGGTAIAYLFSGKALEVNGQARFSNPAIIIMNMEDQSAETLLESKDPTLSKETISSIYDIGWLDNERLWFVTYSGKNAVQSLWVVQSDGKGLRRVIPNLDTYSLPSVRTPLKGIII